jgi:chaperonin GroEL (HSP60 family)
VVRAKKAMAVGYNAAREEFGDMVDMGVIDPTAHRNCPRA